MSQLEERKLCFVPKKLTSLSSLVYGMCCVRPFILCLRVCETKVGHFKSQQSFNTKPVTRQESHNSAKSHIFSMTFLFLYSIQYQHFSSSPFLSTISTPNYNIVKDREDCLPESNPGPSAACHSPSLILFPVTLFSCPVRKGQKNI